MKTFIRWLSHSPVKFDIHVGLWSLDFNFSLTMWHFSIYIENKRDWCIAFGPFQISR